MRDIIEIRMQNRKTLEAICNILNHELISFWLSCDNSCIKCNSTLTKEYYEMLNRFHVMFPNGLPGASSFDEDIKDDGFLYIKMDNLICCDLISCFLIMCNIEFELKDTTFKISL